MHTTDERRRLVGVLLAAYAVVLLLVLLSPSAAVPSTSVSWLEAVASRLHAPQAFLEPGRVEFVANVLILMPAPFLGSMLLPSLTWRDWTAYGFVFSGGVELCQGLFLAGRSATFVDIVANTAGALAGAVLHDVAARRWPSLD